MIFKLKNINNIQNFGNNLHSLQKKQSIAPTELNKISTKFFYKPFVPTEQSFQKWNFSKFLTNLVNFVTNLENFVLQKLYEKLCPIT